MKTHDLNRTPAAPACQPDVVRRLFRHAVLKVQRGGCKIILWLLQPEFEDVSVEPRRVQASVKELKETMIREFR
ncbi:hypothetical protein AtDm6_3359 [Acetobacter tropicalis]|uniref:Uncharacterized protein n=1 Tax=Acetobacter tropicalis TaxID=104102 RepID=A0A094YK26_9PROT|nr:hypothetical protein AtDm6_3359 [Acetobacter tropicalis]